MPTLTRSDAMLEVEDLWKSYPASSGDAVPAVRGVSFSLKAGTMFTLVGPSGCGKTTTLRSIAGLEVPDAGRMRIGDVTVFDGRAGIMVPPDRRRIGMVFQSYAIWPHMTVFENVEFPLRVLPRAEQVSAKERRELVMGALETMGMAALAARSATQLSGGQQQRLALARAIVGRPKLVLLDEPLSNLDAKLRERMRFELKKLQVELGITTIYVTHDQGEALALSDEVAVMLDGRIVQQGTPWEIYHRPRTEFVADFIGSANLLRGTVDQGGQTGDEATVRLTTGPTIRGRFGTPCLAGQEVVVAVRPESVRLLPADNGTSPNALAGTIASRVFLGEITDFLIELAGQDIRARSMGGDQQLSISDRVSVELPPERCLVIGRDPRPGWSSNGVAQEAGA